MHQNAPHRTRLGQVQVLPGQLSFPFLQQAQAPDFEWWACEDCADLFMRATGHDDSEATFERARKLRCSKHHGR